MIRRRIPQSLVARLVTLCVLSLLALFAGNGLPAAAGLTAPVEAQPQITMQQSAKIYPQGDSVQGRTPQSKGLALLFWVFAAVTVGGSIFVITRRNLIAAVMGMVGTFLGVAAVYMLLYAHFLSVIQMLVYAGAIMVLFVFVVMILNKPEDEPVAKGNRLGKALAGVAVLYLVGRVAMILASVSPANPEQAAAAPRPVLIGQVTGPGNTPEFAEWGNTKSVGTYLFNGGLFPFEAISILLLIAVVGAIAVARPLKDDEDAAQGI